ncbi:MAG TPA: hypothetical protein VKK79_11545 [Candidatus Lokiarchaeia archaeon]|nr:hypothetical protein [Candidatus Lokiarchaeia archaeon]
MTKPTSKTIALLGAANIGRTNLLRIFLRYVEQGLIPENIRILKTDFSGESILATGGRKTKTILPNKVNFEDEDGALYELIAPGGETDRPVIKMGAITSSRLSKAIIIVFDLTQDLDPQLEYFNSVKIFLKCVWVCLTKFDLLAEEEQASQTLSYSERVKDFFAQRGIEIKGVAWAGDSQDVQVEEQNAAVVKMILEAARSC